MKKAGKNSLLSFLSSNSPLRNRRRPLGRRLLGGRGSSLLSFLFLLFPLLLHLHREFLLGLGFSLPSAPALEPQLCGDDPQREGELDRGEDPPDERLLQHQVRQVKGKARGVSQGVVERDVCMESCWMGGRTEVEGRGEVVEVEERWWRSGTKFPRRIKKPSHFSPVVLLVL